MAVICVMAGLTLWIFGDKNGYSSNVTNTRNEVSNNPTIANRAWSNTNRALTNTLPVVRPSNNNLNTNSSLPTNRNTNTGNGYPAITVSNVKISSNGNTATVIWTTDVPTGGIFYYSQNTAASRQMLYVSGYQNTNISLSFPITPGVTYRYTIDPCILNADGNPTCAPQPEGAFMADASSSTAQTPTISGITATYVSGQMTVSWKVSPNADGIVNWGPTTSYGQHQSDFAFTGNHSISFAGTSGQTIHYAIRSCTPAPNSVCTASSDRTYTAP